MLYLSTTEIPHFPKLKWELRPQNDFRGYLDQYYGLNCVYAYRYIHIPVITSSPLVHKCYLLLWKLKWVHLKKNKVYVFIVNYLKFILRIRLYKLFNKIQIDFSFDIVFRILDHAWKTSLFFKKVFFNRKCILFNYYNSIYFLH